MVLVWYVTVMYGILCCICIYEDSNSSSSSLPLDERVGRSLTVEMVAEFSASTSSITSPGSRRVFCTRIDMLWPSPPGTVEKAEETLADRELEWEPGQVPVWWLDIERESIWIGFVIAEDMLALINCCVAVAVLPLLLAFAF